MRVKVLSKKGAKLEMLLEETDPAFANSLRRIMMSDVPTMAVQWSDIHENNSALFDEVLSHRLGLIPIRFDPKKFVPTEECTCKGKGCPACQVVFILDKKGPALVVSGDLVSTDKKVAPTDPNISIVDLLEGQSVKLEAVARLGIGKTHAKHHAANASFQFYPVITAKGSKTDMQNAIRACPKGVLALKGNKIMLKDPAKCDLCRSCMEHSKGVELKADESRIIFKVESISGLDPDYIVDKAVEILQGKAEDFRKKIERI
ncbi:MAG: DNA-directed RNA polymerase subunit D [Candidatus Aenigmarchaeota archaeon]|nr:DNA-directed RNA polymerase subunit D [Candidatus Aenigmarchaeota archaeon]